MVTYQWLHINEQHTNKLVTNDYTPIINNALMSDILISNTLMSDIQR